MSEEKKTDPKKALKHESKGDKLFQKEKFRQALEEYRKSEALNPDRMEIYQKLIETHTQFEHEWAEEDFSNSLSWTMRYQELQNPEIKWVHDTFTPEYQEVQKLIQSLMMTVDRQMEPDLIRGILGYGEKALLPLIHFALSIKTLSQAPAEGSPSSPEPPSPPPNS